MSEADIYVQEDMQPGMAREISPGVYEVIVSPEDWERLRICKSFTGELEIDTELAQITLDHVGPKPLAIMRRISRA